MTLAIVSFVEVEVVAVNRAIVSFAEAEVTTGTHVRVSWCEVEASGDEVLSGTGIKKRRRRSLEDLYSKIRIYDPKELARQEPEHKPRLPEPFVAEIPSLDPERVALVTARMQATIDGLKAQAAEITELERQQDDDAIALLLLMS